MPLIHTFLRTDARRPLAAARTTLTFILHSPLRCRSAIAQMQPLLAALPSPAVSPTPKLPESSVRTIAFQTFARSGFNNSSWEDMRRLYEKVRRAT